MNEQMPAAPATSWQSASVSAIVQQTPKIKSFFFNLPQSITFFAGQHVDVRLTAPNGYSAVRSYSIASAPEDPRIELAIELLENGEVSPFFHETVAVGDAIDLRGPLGGHFIWSTDRGGPLLLIGGGSGIVPLISMLRLRKSLQNRVPAILLLSARTWTDIPFRDELLALDAAHDGFELVLTLTRDTRRRTTDYQRHIDGDMMREVLARLPSPPALAYACGTNQFVDVAVDAAMEADIPTATDIRTERYGG
ncbi:MAG TPA: FAD-binding oxidoreductase [Candidatus Acidoferrales bacterium]|nr:FAD-binding oxidoreductase [Candidatus Acidoferrales bacterium]